MTRITKAQLQEQLKDKERTIDLLRKNTSTLKHQVDALKRGMSNLIKVQMMQEKAIDSYRDASQMHRLVTICCSFLSALLAVGILYWSMT